MHTYGYNSGERAASALEDHLASLEEKIESLLAAVESSGNSDATRGIPQTFSNPENQTGTGDNTGNNTNNTRGTE